MPQLVRAFPLRRPVEELQEFARALAGRRAEADAFYRGFGIARESWHVQHTPSGPWVIGVTEIADPGEAAPRYAGSTTGFDTWFKEQVRHLTGIDPDAAPLGPPTTQVFDWSDQAAPTVQLAASPAPLSAG
jgi:hypothetical protein